MFLERTFLLAMLLFNAMSVILGVTESRQHMQGDSYQEGAFVSLCVFAYGLIPHSYYHHHIIILFTCCVRTYTYTQNTYVRNESKARRNEREDRAVSGKV